ncbi:MAG: hypothetical protein BM564_06810 [Bacteroidetes bacterium MedPE-SWsnd-G2]|nr:MAG: hypothetical protein BM564_06810 [Bacteroidetes bacterium MedPE-SWsnd-G2]
MLAQVGIGTMNPDPSSILELNSKSQGFLAPRLSTAERIGISSPAEGLMVYDTDEAGIFVYSGSKWIEINGADTRDNYVLVKSVDDFPDAVDGKITLDTNTVYEINGSITLNVPIELNESTVFGIDLYADELFYNGNGALFTGSTGGTLSNFAIRGNNSNQLFDLTGTGLTGRILTSLNMVSDFSKLGIIDAFNLVILKDLSFVNNADGIVFKDIMHLTTIHTLFLFNNQGTLMKFEGSFNDIGMLGGVFEVNNVGVDVSSNPIILSEAFISGISFSGSGTMVNGSFSKEWTIDTPGLATEKDEVASTDMHFINSGGAVTTFNSASETKKLEGNTTTDLSHRFVAVGNNRLQYTGLKKRYFNIMVSGSFKPSNELTYVFYVAKNGVVDQSSKAVTQAPSGWFSSEGKSSFSIASHIELEPGDYIEIYVGKEGSGSSDVRLYSTSVVVF